MTHAPWKWLAVAASVLLLAALMAAGATGAVRYAVTFWLYRGFAAPEVPRSVRVGSSAGARQVPVVLPAVRTISVRSPALGGYRDRVYVMLPPGYASDPGTRYPVLYLLHGFPGEPTQFIDVAQVAAVEATLVAGRRMRPMILVMPTGTRSFLADEEWANGIRPHNAWDTFVAHDLVKAIDSRYRTIAGGRGRGIGGLSEGGYAALNIGLHHPGEFTVLESWSGYMQADRMPGIFGHTARVHRYNSPALWVPAVAARIRASRTFIWFYIGTSDGLVRQNQAFSAELSALHIAHHFFEVPGSHNWGTWRGRVPMALITASRHLSHA